MRRKWLAALLLPPAGAVALYAVLAASARPAPDHAYFAGAAPRTAVIAHRGGAGLRPENTLAAFAHAVQIGADVLDLDARATADGVIVALHDATLDRTTDGSGRVDSMTIDELKRLDAGYRWSNDGGTSFPFRGKGIRVPTLEEVFAVHGGTRMLVEMKPRGRNFAVALCSVMRASGMSRRVLVGAFDDDSLAAFRAACPEAATALASGEARLFIAAAVLRLAGLTTPPAPALVIPDRLRGWTLARPLLLAAARSRNVNVQVWTVNDVARMRELVSIGVDGILTDRPDRLLSVLAAPERRLSLARPMQMPSPASAMQDRDPAGERRPMRGTGFGPGQSAG